MQPMNYTMILPMRPGNATLHYPINVQPYPSSHPNIQHYSYFPCYTPASPSRKIESESCHTALVLVNRGCAVFLGILRIAEEHTLVASSLFLLTYTAWLFRRVSKLAGIQLARFRNVP